MKVHKRGFIFLTFLGSCASIVLLAAAFGTKYWTVANAKNTHNPSKSNGKINIGLFEGEKSLNIGYGLRTYHINVMDVAQNELNILVYSLWLSTIIGLSLGLLFSVISAIFSLINTATTPISALTGIAGLYLWNILAVLFEMVAISIWIYQFCVKLQHNMLTLNDRKLAWTTEGMAHLSYSFWFVIIGAIIQIINLVIICYATSNKTKNTSPIIEEKGNGAIMLY
ncbi:hypothetical protein PGB90_009825 [Kerria lacca]